MTIAELVKKLQEFPPDTNVEVLCPYDCGAACTGGPVVDVYLHSDGVVVIDADENGADEDIDEGRCMCPDCNVQIYTYGPPPHKCPYCGNELEFDTENE